ncbi:MAG: hypothetical protein Ct9H300mP30_1290 [Methanobacteriota archaeon]|nr:MAG: hypothetical protein Ct9H300mP30_1290 [Euryarchaeota archaeon]
MESITPGARHGLLHSLMRYAGHREANQDLVSEVRNCSECGEITSREVCQACTMKQWLAETA